MDQYVTGAVIRKLREERKLSQSRLAEILGVSDKAVSKWETGRGYPDITLIEPLADALGISVIELLRGRNVTNTNRSANMEKLRFYVCPICGNVLCAAGEAVVSCCGVTLPPLEAEEPEGEHRCVVEDVEDEKYVRIVHPMNRAHFISFIAAVRDEGFELVKLYPEGGAEARVKTGRTRWLYWYCNRHGLFRLSLRGDRRG
ncbi:MAG: helix-turn-helix domain-containing protein [Oscillospiraceae bacterium]|nr:helix-turn-helix domain-containing protein [Oscillospiraceae bacterium]